MKARGGKAADLWQRFGFFTAAQAEELGALTAAGRVIWVHAVSVGEVGIADKLVRELSRRDPALRFVVTSTTPTGHALAGQLAGQLPGRVTVLYSALDAWGTVRRFLRAVDPAQIILVEAEVWPNLVFAAHRRRIPVSLVNARLSPRSERRFRKVRALVRPIFTLLERVCVQEPEDVARFVTTFGLDPVRVIRTGSIKFDMAGDTDPVGQVQEFQRLVHLLGWQAGDPVVLAASTHPGEELEFLRVCRRLKESLSHLRIIVVPRHVERCNAIAAELQAEGWRPARRSDKTATPTDLLLVDTTGELRAWQHLATVVVIGKSFLAKGGQNPAEAAAARRPVVFGPHMENFAALVDLLLAGNGAVQVPDFPSLEAVLEKLFRDPAGAERLGLAGHAVLEAHRGSTERTAELLLAGS